MKLKPANCTFCSQKVDFLGHIVYAEGVRPDASKVNRVVDWPQPNTKKEVQQFLGPKPLHCLMGRNTPLEWSEECQAAFVAIKQKLTSAPILVFPDFSRPFILDTDASYTGLGGVLFQV